ncbi:MAG TPA: hypothetical protein VM305_01955 [Candidatus Limnocylindrales bacterium]|nr:hypothetical protein [Candidatus Limnocylindrales bacterium]
MATVVSADEISAVMATGLEPDALADLIAREEAWLANDSQFGIGQVTGERTQTLWVGRDYWGPLLLARPTDGPTAVVDAGVDVTDDVVLTGTARLERASRAAWAGPRVDVTYEPNDTASVKRVVIELVRLAISASPYQAEATDGHSRSYDVGGAAKLRAQLARSLRPHAGPLTAHLGSAVLPPAVRT